MDRWRTKDYDASGHGYVEHEVIRMTQKFQLQLHDFFLHQPFSGGIMQKLFSVKLLNCVTLVNLPYVLEALKHYAVQVSIQKSPYLDLDCKQ